jgi:hypothetical protein
MSALAVCLATAACTSHPVSTPTTEPASTSSISTTTTPHTETAVTKPSLLQPPGPDVQPPPLLAMAASACAKVGAVDATTCAGAVDAYVWGYPLVVMSDTRNRLACVAGVNHLLSATKLSGPSSTSVVAPNNDTLYSTAFLDLRAAPVVLTMPAVNGRYVNFQLLDMYTNTFADIGILTDGGRAGSYAIVGPGWKGSIPSGTHRIDAPTPDVWLLGRTGVNGPSDLAAAVAVQSGYELTVLPGHGHGTSGGKSTMQCGGSSTSPDTTSVSLFDQIASDMEADPPAPQDKAIASAMAAAGVEPGKSPTIGARATTLAAYTAALRIGARLIAEGAVDLGSTSSGGWSRQSVAGTFGTQYLTRAVVARFGLGEQVPSQAIYLSATKTASGAALTGSDTYRVTFAHGQLPPFDTDGFWSITMYDASDFLVANSIDRYSIGNRTQGLVYGPNGSLTIAVSPTKPTNPDDNWLPSPTGTFRMTLRIYAPAATAVNGSWHPPPIEAAHRPPK